ncbi:MAG: hypothetical protein WAQ99_09200 [Pyrinomonadaceae bacterium]
MSAEQWLGLALRIVGAIVFLYGVGYLVDGALFHLEYFIYADSSVNYYIVVGLLYCTAGGYLLRGAPHVVRFAYPQEEGTEEPAEDEGNADDRS